ncbi:MAG: nicotinamide-nucleotide adenylyltransferase [Desulfurococcaceae archaeon]
MYVLINSNRCLVIARFQPLHHGHLNVLKYCSSICSETVVVIGMASRSHTPDNPFTAGERVLMIRESLKWAKLPLENYITVTLPTIEVSRIAVHYVKLYSPPFEYVIALNPFVQRIFSEEGYKVISPPEFNRNIYRGSVIRSMIARGDDKWKELVPPPVVDIIEKVDGINRIKMLYRGEFPSSIDL